MVYNIEAVRILIGFFGVWLSLVECLVREQITDYERKNSKTAENP